jgi:hypothetical protein
MSGWPSEEYRGEEGAEQSVTDVEVLTEIYDRHSMRDVARFRNPCCRPYPGNCLHSELPWQLFVLTEKGISFP